MLVEKFGLYSVLSLSTFSLFAEYFIAISAIYITIVMSLLAYNVNGLMFQRALSDCLGLTLLMACYLIVNDDILATGLSSFHLSIVNDSLSFFSKFIICFFSALFFFSISDSLKEQMLTSFEYLTILLFAVLGLILLCSSNDLLTSYLAIELTSLSSYLLASFRNNSNYSIEAGIKYFITGAVSSALFLLGSSFIYAFCGSIYFSDFWDLFSSDIEYFYSKPFDLDSYYCDVVADVLLRQSEGVSIADQQFINTLLENSWYFMHGENWPEIVAKKALSDKNFPDPSNYVINNLFDKNLYYQDVVATLNYSPDHVLLEKDRYGSNWVEFVGKELVTGENLPSIDKYISSANVLSEFNKDSVKFVEIGMVFILFSLFIKLALAPFHLWSLDVYEGSPTSSTFFFAVITKLSLFIFLIRFCYVGMFCFNEEWQFFTMWAAIFSVFVGSFGGLKQRKLKTLLAYSSISHMGYGLLALSSVSLFGVRILLFYMTIYMISGICTWFIILLLRLKQPKSVFKYNKELGDLALLNKSNPAIAFGLAVTMFSIAGLPPLVGFLAKIGVFLSLLRENLYFICIIAILCSVVSTFYYIRVVKVLYFENLLVGKLYHPIETNKTLLLSVSVFLLIFLFLNPTVLFLVLYNVTFDSLFFDFSFFK